MARSTEVKSLKSGSAWVWWGMIAGAVAIALLCVVYALRASSNGAVNRGPGDEAAPGAHPSRDIDRSANR
ncbi:MAG TPA: hypothetical protein VEQ59_18800 [Polyangiaceae bacterium]|nr:hypothetical protein [Polyangiaceae bacterium]